MKKCIVCHQDKVISLFPKDRNQCKDCKNSKRKCEHGVTKYTCTSCRPELLLNINSTTQTKICNACKETKTLNNFDLFSNKCKACKYKNSLCEHGKEKRKCKECKGSQICMHGKLKSICKDCHGSSICEHNKIRINCVDCNGSQICEHGKIRCRCKECHGSSICEHNKIRINCVDCNGSQICIHGKLKYYCLDCDGSQICIHQKKKKDCIECTPSLKCEHNKFKHACIICNPNLACSDCGLIYVDKTTFCYPLCEGCFSFKYPNHEKVTRYKIKERYLVDELKKRLDGYNIEMICDKVIFGGCSMKRPDILIDCLTYSIIIECDENQHKTNYECENKRIMQLFMDLGNRPLVVIRFNPDSYINKKGKRINTCFKPIQSEEQINYKRFYEINTNEWNRRVDYLYGILLTYIGLNDFINKEITEHKCFYDNFD